MLDAAAPERLARWLYEREHWGALGPWNNLSNDQQAHYHRAAQDALRAAHGEDADE